MTDDYIERKILIGMIVSTEYLTRIRKIWNSKLLIAPTAKKVSGWCMDYYDKYGKAPDKQIESIFQKKAKRMDKIDIEGVAGVLEGLSGEYERRRKGKFNVDYLYDQSIEYWDELNIRDFLEELDHTLETGELADAKKLAMTFTNPIDAAKSNSLDLSDEDKTLEAIERAFTKSMQPVVKYSQALGEFWNSQLIRGGFVAFMAPEKRGKTFWLLDVAMRAAAQGANVAFFQAGDMTEDQQLRRISIYLAGKSDRKKYAGKMYEPVRDCWKNQIDKCNLRKRVCDIGVFEDDSRRNVMKKINFNELTDAFESNPDYTPCTNCSAYRKKSNRYGATWLKEVDVGHALSVNGAKRVVSKFFIKGNKRFKLSTHPSKSLTVSEMDNIMDLWEREDQFVADLIVVDYVDIMESELQSDFRHQENDKWMRLRGMSEKRKALVLTVTQTDAKSYKKGTLSLDNFSEDKRKFAHVTAMYGLNQDTKGIEKEIGVMRINEIVVREDSFSMNTQVTVLQNLSRGKPCIGSFW